jgi:hypothetical protein
MVIHIFHIWEDEGGGQKKHHAITNSAMPDIFIIFPELEKPCETKVHSIMNFNHWAAAYGVAHATMTRIENTRQ